MKLRDISNNDTLTLSAVVELLKNSVLLQLAEFYQMTGNADNKRKAASASGGSFRALDNNYASNQITPAFASVVLKIFGGHVQVDRAHERRGADIGSVRATELVNFVKNLAKNFNDKFFNGVISATEFNGLKAIMPAGQKLAPATDGFQVLAGNDNTARKSQQAFVEYIHYLISKLDGGAGALFMNGAVLARLTTIANEHIVRTPNEFGVLIPYFDGIPLINPGYNASGTEILPSTETCGTNAATTSIYAVSFGESSNLSIASNKGLEVVDLGLVGVHYTHSVELDADLALLNDKAVGQLAGIEIV